MQIGAAFLFGRAAQALDIARMLGMSAVGKIQPRNVHAQAHQVAQRGFGIARRPDGTNDLGAANGSDGELRRQIT